MADTSYFILSSDRAGSDGHKLLSYSGAVKAGKMTMTLKFEVSGWDMHRTVEDLEAILRAHNAKPAAAPKKPAVAQKAIGKAKPLALPAPNDFQL